jgi:hypothetical protein
MTGFEVRPARDARTAALVSALVEQGLVPREREAEAAAVVDRTLGGQETLPAPVRRRIAELAGYVGGAFVVAAGGIFFASQWGSLSRGEQVGLLAGIAVLLATAAVALGLTGPGFARMREGAEPVRHRLTSVLLIGAAGAAGAAVGIWSEPLTEPMQPTGVLLGMATFVALTLVGYLLAPTMASQVAMAWGAFMLVPLTTDTFGEGSGTAMGFGVLGVGLLWLLLAERGIWREVATGRVVGCGFAVIGAQMTVFTDQGTNWFGYLVLAAVAVGAFGMYVARPAWPYLAAGVVALTLVVPEALLDWFDDALGPAGALLVAGVTLLAASLAGLRLRKEVSHA